MGNKYQRSNIKDQKWLNGFTLIELLAALSIIAIVTSLGIVSFIGSQQEARNAQRKNDIRQYQVAIENFATNNGSLFPSWTDITGGRASDRTKLCGSLTRYIANCPEDTKYASDPSFSYLYQSNGTGSGTATATSWVLWSKLERVSNFWVVCSNGRSGEKAREGFSVSGGTCPL